MSIINNTMEVWGYDIPLVEIPSTKIYDDESNITLVIADLRLWELIGNYCMSGDDDANAIDEQIFFYMNKPLELYKSIDELVEDLKKYL